LRRSNWWAIPYGILLGVGFLLSPVVQSLGIGLFGVDFGWHFAATVLTAHLAFGTALAALLTFMAKSPSANLGCCVRSMVPVQHAR